MDPLIYASLSHTHYWYEVGMLKIPAIMTYDHVPGAKANYFRIAAAVSYPCYMCDHTYNMILPCGPPIEGRNREYVWMYGHTYSKSMDQPGKVANPARVQLNRESEYFPVRVRA